MKITHLTYARVAPDATPDPPRPRPKGDGVEKFLGDHIESLFAMAKKPDAPPPGRIDGEEARRLFRDLHAGSASDFLTAAYALTLRLIGRMNGATAEGLLVCLRADTPEHGRVAGVLKLEVVTPNGAVLRELDSGETVLAAVTDLLDSPGKLHKGALVTSGLADGQVICGDRLAQAALYFPKAFDIRTFCRPSDATKAFFDALEECAGPVAAEVVPEVAAAWPAVQPGSPDEVLAELAQKVPGLTASLRADIAERLRNAARPVARLDTRRTVKETYQAGAITVSGPIDEMRRRVRRVPIGGGPGWQIIVDSPERPVTAHQ
ncbi:MAG TPA: hypothetical protein VF069_03710 [Streptosporangiaceae bacterium]